MRMDTHYFPDFLYFSLGFWLILLAFFAGFFIYIKRLPDNRIHEYKAKAIENKKRLGIKIYKF
jgi:hypothetical protein